MSNIQCCGGGDVTSEDSSTSSGCVPSSVAHDEPEIPAKHDENNRASARARAAPSRKRKNDGKICTRARGLSASHGESATINTEWWVVGACCGAAVLLCAAAGVLAHPRLRRRHAAAAAAATNPMLSVQVPGCAGMERLGAPGGPRLRHEHRHHSTLEWENQQRLQAMVGRLQEMVEQESRARSAAAAERLGLPPSIQLPDGEYGQDAHLQLRVPYQQAELTRSSFQPPPNKCVSDVPEWAGAGGGVESAGGRARPGQGKKDGLLQKATRWWVRMGARPPPPHYLTALGERRATPPPPPPPCVMVPRRPPPPPRRA